jgi:hypothetical protein
VYQEWRGGVSDIAAIIWLLVVGFSAGFSWCERSYRHDPHKSSKKIGNWLIGEAKKVEDTKKFVGSGMSIIHRGQWRIGNAIYDITLQPSEEEEL